MREWVREWEREMNCDRNTEKGEGEWERVQKHREKEAHAGHPHNAHSYVV